MRRSRSFSRRSRKITRRFSPSTTTSWTYTNDSGFTWSTRITPRISKGPSTKSACLRVATVLTISRVYVVDAASASPQLPGVIYYGIEATHSGMAKFDSENAPGYRNVSTAIRQWVAESTSVIKLRWEVEEEDRRLRANLESYERIRAYVSVAFSRISRF